MPNTETETGTPREQTERLVWIANFGEPLLCFGSLDDLAHHLDNVNLCGEGHVTKVYALNGGELTEAKWKISGTPYDANDWATSTVTVTLADGAEICVSWRVDGRG